MVSKISKILLIHGAYMHPDDFNDLKKYLKKNKISPLSVDLRQGLRDLSYQGYLENARKALKKFGPCAVLGISLGGIILSELLDEPNLKKAIFLSTPIGKNATNMKYSLLMAKMLPQLLSGKIRVNAKELTEDIDEKIYAEIESRKVFEPAKVMKESSDFEKVLNNIKKSKKPIIMAYGKNDFTINLDELEKLKNAKIKVFEGMSHFLIHEKKRKEAYDFILGNL